MPEGDQQYTLHSRDTQKTQLNARSQIPERDQKLPTPAPSDPRHWFEAPPRSNSSSYARGQETQNLRAAECRRRRYDTS